MTLDKLAIGQSAKIIAVGGEGSLRNRLIDMGLIPKTTVMLRKVAPMGDPIEIRISSVRKKQQTLHRYFYVYFAIAFAGQRFTTLRSPAYQFKCIRNVPHG